MNTVRSEKIRWGRLMSRQISCGAHKLIRSLEHFRISTEKMPTSLIHALALTKRAAAKVNEEI